MDPGGVAGYLSEVRGGLSARTRVNEPQRLRDGPIFVVIYEVRAIEVNTSEIKNKFPTPVYCSLQLMYFSLTSRKRNLSPDFITFSRGHFGENFPLAN